MSEKEIKDMALKFQAGLLEGSYQINQKLQQENQQLHNKMDELEKYSRGNIEACDNRLNSPFCNFERVTKELMIHKNYLEILKESDVDE